MVKPFVKRTLSWLFWCAVLFAAASLSWFLWANTDRPVESDLSAREILESGYKYFIYGSQNTGGIEAYDLSSLSRRQLFTPRANERLILPDIGPSGVGVYVRRTNEFSNQRYDDVITFDLSSGVSTPILELRAARTMAIKLSADGRIFAYVSNISTSSWSPFLGIYDLGNRKMLVTYPLHGFDQGSLFRLVWVSGAVVVGQAGETNRSLKVNITTGQQEEVSSAQPLASNGRDRILVVEGRTLYVVDIMGNTKEPVEIGYDTAHSLSLSRDGRYLLYGWLRGKGFETIALLDLKKRRQFQLKMNDHPGTLMGLVLW